MTIGITTSSYTKDGIIDYAKMKRHGYACCDYSALCDTTDIFYTCDETELAERMAKEKAHAEEGGIVLSQVHGPWPVIDTTEALRVQNLGFMKRAVLATALLGCKELVVHPVMPYEWAKETDPAWTVQINEAYFRELCDYAAAHHVFICLENMPTHNHTIASVTSVVDFVRRLDHPALAICLDTGHANVTGENIGDAVRMCGDLLHVLHIHDNDGTRDAHRLPYLGGGTVDWDAFRAALADISFTGCLSMETEIPRCTPEPAKETLQIGLAQIAASFGA